MEVVDIAVPPDAQLDVIKNVCKHKKHIRGILAQKPLGVNYDEAKEIVQLCRRAGITLAVNQNMRYDQSIRACKSLLDQGLLGRAGAGDDRHAGDPALDAVARAARLGHAADHVDSSP